MSNKLINIAILSLLLFAFSASAQEQPVVYSQTVIGIVPGNIVPKAITQSPELQSPQQAATDTPAENTTDAMLQQATSEQPKLRVQVRNNQIPLNSGLFLNYRLDAGHGVLTYFGQVKPRNLVAENIQAPLDVLFIRDDGIIAQIVPEIVMAYLPDNIGTDFPIRALLYVQAGLSAEWGIQPGHRIEHGMFNPKPLIYRVEEGK